MKLPVSVVVSVDKGNKNWQDVEIVLTNLAVKMIVLNIWTFLYNYSGKHQKISFIFYNKHKRYAKQFTHSIFKLRIVYSIVGPYSAFIF